MAIDDRTPNLNLPLPNSQNLLSEDVERLRTALGTLDTEVADKADADAVISALSAKANTSDVDTALAAKADTSDVNTALAAKADLVDGKVPVSQLPAIAPESTDSVPEGATNLYFTDERALAAVPLATASTPGRVKPGTGLSVDAEGTLNATGSDQTFDDLVLTVSSAGQTSFTVSGGYTPGAIDVHLNGVKLNGGGDDYTATDGANLTLTVGANLSDLLVLRRWATFEVADAVTPTGAQTLTNKTLSGAVLNDGYTEEVFAVTGTTPALSPANGSIQTWTLSGNSTPTAGTWNEGQSITLMVDDGSARTITWTSLAVTWKTDGGSAPTLNTTGFTAIALWKVGTVIYGARVGDA